MRFVSRWLPGVLAVMLSVSTALALDGVGLDRAESGRAGQNQAELDLRFKQAMAVGDSLSEKATGEVSQASAREALLRGILADAPDYEPARAELGQVKVDGRWLPVDYAQHLASEDPRLAEYETLRQAADDTLADHRRLARWCEKQGLTHEARPHWFAVLAARPQHPAALDGLNAEWIDGALWDVELAKETQDRAESIAKAAKKWERRFSNFESGRTVRKSELVAIRDELDVAAIGPIERRFESLLRPTDGRSAKRARQLADAWFEVVRDFDEVEVTASLCRLAVFSAEDDRRRAIELLKARPQFDTMPILLSGLAPPVDSHARITREANGSVTYEHRLGRQGEEVYQKHQRMWTASVSLLPGQQLNRRFLPGEEVRGNLRTFLDAQYATLWQEAAFRARAVELDGQVADHNERVAEINGRVLPALRAVSGVELGDDPVDWWKYWQEHSGYDRYSPRVDRTYDFDDQNYYVQGPPIERHECFVAGTPVWTRTGKMAIEKLKPGDLVMARDPHRGGLTYRAVLETTVRRPSPMVSITLRGEQEEIIHATVGHPFWIVGEGWRMAKNLEAGDLVSTVNGPRPIAQVIESPDRKAHNLVVEGAANYYVGENGVLVHDNTPRKPAVGLVAKR